MMEARIEAVMKGGATSAMLPIAALQPSPTNPRKGFDKARLAELADSIRAKGVLQPILVRPLGKGMEIVAGERRWKAAKTAGLAEIPAIVREMADAEVLEVQLVENLQRDDLHPLEEAEGYERLQKQGLTVEDLAAKVGKSKAYVYARLKLTMLVPEAWKAFHAGKLNPSTALLVARIPVPELQKQAVEEITDPSRGFAGDEGMSVREAAEFIQENYMLRLEEAPWPLADAQLVPGAGACTSCPKRTGNQRELFGDVKSADVCTDPKCFQTKKAAWQAQVRAEAEASGRQVIAGKEAKAIKPQEHSPELKGYVDLSQRCYHDPKGRNYQALLGKHAEKAALLEDPHTKELKAVMPTADVTKALKEKGYSWAEGRRAVATDPGRAEQRKRDRKARLEREVRHRIHEAIRAKVKERLSREDLVLVAGAFFDDIWDENRKRVMALWGWDHEKPRRSGRTGAGHDQIARLKEADVPRFLIDLALAKETHVSAWDDSKPVRLLATAKRYGVDAEKLRRTVQVEAKKPKTAKAKKPGKAKPAKRKA